MHTMQPTHATHTPQAKASDGDAGTDAAAAPAAAPSPAAAAPEAEAFARLPLLGPVAWLFARSAERRFLFLGDLDWAVMPPVLLDQCQLFMRGKLPFAYVSWARVDAAVHARLLSGNPRLAPHEWRGGGHLWLIDVVTPFGETANVLRELREKCFPGQTLPYLSLDAATQTYQVRKVG